MIWPHIEYGPHDWPEDASHENGNYNNVCVHCNHVFIGYKRRVCCKVCTVASPPVSAKELSEAWAKIRADDEPTINLSQPRERPYLKETIYLDDPQQLEKLRGARIGVTGPGAEAIVEKMRMHGIDAVIHTPGKTTSLPAPDQALQVFKSEYRSIPKEKAQWKRERNGRR